MQPSAARPTKPAAALNCPPGDTTSAFRGLGHAAPDPVSDMRSDDLSARLAALVGAIEGFEARRSGPDPSIVLVWHLSKGPARGVTPACKTQHRVRPVSSHDLQDGRASGAMNRSAVAGYQRATNRPMMAPASPSRSTPIGYQVATNKGESSVQWAA